MTDGSSTLNPYSGEVVVTNTATLAINAGKKITTGAITVNSDATLEVAESAASAGTASVTLGGNLTLADGATLAFNFTERNTVPTLAIASGKTVTVSGTVKVKVSGRDLSGKKVWPKGKSGGHQLTTCGGFTSGNVVFDETEMPNWVKEIKVENGNIVLDVKPRNMTIIVR